MRAGLRIGIAAAAAALVIGQAPAVAQEAPANNAADVVGPRDLENFSLNGTVTRSAPEPTPEPAATTAPPPRRTPAAPAETAEASAAQEAVQQPVRPRTSAPRRVEPSATAPIAVSNAIPSLTGTLPPVTSSESAPTPEPAFAPEPAPTGSRLSPGTGFSPLPWIIAILLLGGAAAFYFLRHRRGDELAFAGAPGQAFVPPPPAAPPRAAPTPPPAPLPPPAAAPRAPEPPTSTGIVATRLRPWVEVEFQPLRCVVEADRVTIQCTVVLFNSGSAPARDVLVEALMINAGPQQDEEIGAFFAHPVGAGDRIPAIAPLKRVEVTSAISLGFDKLRQFEAQGRRFFVPLIALNALYKWSSNEGQTSASYLVGREGDGDGGRMAPLRLDLGPRIFRGLGAREHALKVRK